jgi:hypothetical protein
MLDANFVGNFYSFCQEVFFLNYLIFHLFFSEGRIIP